MKNKNDKPKLISDHLTADQHFAEIYQVPAHHGMASHKYVLCVYSKSNSRQVIWSFTHVNYNKTKDTALQWAYATHVLPPPLALRQKS